MSNPYPQGKENADTSPPPPPILSISCRLVLSVQISTCTAAADNDDVDDLLLGWKEAVQEKNCGAQSKGCRQSCATPQRINPGPWHLQPHPAPRHMQSACIFATPFFKHPSQKPAVRPGRFAFWLVPLSFPVYAFVFLGRISWRMCGNPALNSQFKEKIKPIFNHFVIHSLISERGAS